MDGGGARPRGDKGLPSSSVNRVGGAEALLECSEVDGCRCERELMQAEAEDEMEGGGTGVRMDGGRMARRMRIDG